MASRPSQKVIKAKLRRLTRKYPGVEFRVLYASNGEVAILPEDSEKAREIMRQVDNEFRQPWGNPESPKPEVNPNV